MDCKYILSSYIKIFKAPKKTAKEKHERKFDAGYYNGQEHSSSILGFLVIAQLFDEIRRRGLGTRLDADLGVQVRTIDVDHDYPGDQTEGGDEK